MRECKHYDNSTGVCAEVRRLRAELAEYKTRAKTILKDACNYCGWRIDYNRFLCMKDAECLRAQKAEARLALAERVVVAADIYINGTGDGREDVERAISAYRQERP